MRRLLPLLLVLALSCTAGATIIFDNLGGSSNGVDTIAGFGPLSDSFSTGANGFSLTEVGLKMEDIGTPTGSFTIELLADNNINPGNPIYTIATVQDSSLTNSLQDYFFTLSQSQLLAPNTRYWIGLSSTDNSVAYWSWTVDTSGVGVDGEYFANQNGVFTNNNGAYQMQISGDVVPEPGTLLTMGTGMVGLLGVLRRKLG
ncbi:MAG: choice-of-anchor R domain-containing protein [Candidatus Korobacteraceae bacterium]